MIVLDGKKVQTEIAWTLRRKIGAFSTAPKLAILQVGDKKESTAYIRQKKFFAERIGVKVEHIPLPLSVSEYEVISKVTRLNENRDIHGIILQLPLPDSLNKQKLLDSLTSSKDVDGLGSANVALRAQGTPYFWPATARGILELLNFYGVTLEGKRVAVLGRSALVGQPAAELLHAKGAEVTVCHRETPNTKEITRESDIVVVAIGKPRLIGREYFRADQTQTVVDVGINVLGGVALAEEVPRRALVGDVDFETVKDMVAAISPVPGGVGPMTVASLFENLVEAYGRQHAQV